MQAKAFDSCRRSAVLAVIGACFLFGGCAAHSRASASKPVAASGSERAATAHADDARGEPERDTPRLIPVVFETGRATYYARRFDGRRTASGERYDMRSLSAAHRTLPLGSYVRVTDVRNKRSVVVRINDRGPFVKDRVIDLSFAAATLIGLQQAGSAQVTLERVLRAEADKRRVEIAQTHAPARHGKRTKARKKHHA